MLFAVFAASSSPRQPLHRLRVLDSFSLAKSAQANVDFINRAQSSQNLHIPETKFKVQLNWHENEIWSLLALFRSAYIPEDSYILCDK